MQIPTLLSLVLDVQAPSTDFIHSLEKSLSAKVFKICGEGTMKNVAGDLVVYSPGP